ncbi:MAG: aldo/keto reductase [Campylobacterales bacterium]
MEYRFIGRSGLRVTPICLGTMTFGNMCDKKTSFEIMDKAYERGINFFDTAELYPVPPTSKLAGITEEIVGEWMQNKDRDSLIIATKVAGASSGWFAPPIRHGLTAIDRHHIIKAVEGSLRRLQTDYIDLYQVHWPDMVVPMEESMEALDELVRSGKVRYLGTSNESAYGLTKSNEIARFKGYKRFESIQNNFSMLNRRFLDSIAEVCRREKVSLLPYSPIAGGVLSGKYCGGFFPKSARFSDYFRLDNPRQKAMAERFVNDKTLKSTQKLMEIAKEYGISATTLAVAWSMDFDFVASTMTGATNPKQLDDHFKALEFKIDDELRAKCDAVHDEFMYPMG